MLGGFTRPFTPAGEASVVPSLPWSFAGDQLLIHFQTDADALEALLPPPLHPVDRGDEAFLWSPHLRCHPENMSPNQLGPSRTHYNVCVIGIPCLLRGARTMFSAFQWGDRDWLVVLSWFLGACSKLVTIDQTGHHPMLSPGPYGGGIGSTLRRTVSRHGEKIIEIGFEPCEAVNAQTIEFYTRYLPVTCLRHFPDCEVPRRGRPLVHDLTQMVMSDIQLGEALRGAATLRFFDADNEELLPIQPLKVINGYWIPMSFRLHGIRVVHNYLE